MSEERVIRINKVLKELNISLDRAVDFLKSKGQTIDANPNAKISKEEENLLSAQFSADKGKKVESLEATEEKRKEKEALRIQKEKEKEQQELQKQKEEDEKRRQQEVIKAKAEVAKPKLVDKINLDTVNKTEVNSTTNSDVKSSKTSVPKSDVVKEKKINNDNQPKPQVKSDNKDTQDTNKVKQPLKNQEASNVVVATNAAEKEVTPATEETIITTNYQTLSGPSFTGQKIDLSQFNKPKKKKEEPKANATKGPGNKVGDNNSQNKNKRKRIVKPEGTTTTGTAPKEGGNAPNNANRPPYPRNNNTNSNNNNRFKKNNTTPRGPIVKVEPTEEQVKNQIKETLERLQGKNTKSKSAKYRKDKRDNHRQKSDDELRAMEEGNKVLKVTEFVTVGEIASMMEVPITKVIGTCMSLGIMVTMNQRLDAETLTIVADEFGYQVEFTTADIEENIVLTTDNEEDLVSRPPIVTVMGHVDHGKTSLLDYIRKTNVIAGESGGITQHIGAYNVKLANGQRITFLDTPGHEAFTAMRARGAQITDIVIIVIAADDDIMPQTKEAISHAQAAGVPIIFAINKVDKQTSNPEKIKEKLAGLNFLVEDWGGKYQSQDVSAKQGIGMEELLEKVLLEAELLDLKANPNKPALGAVVEAQLDKGRGYVTTMLVQAGTLRIGDYVLAGKNHGKVRAMFDERGKTIKEAGPSIPISILGLDGAPTAGDKFNVFEDEREAKQIAVKRTQLLREQSVRAQKHITLAEIGRRIALGQFKELNIILKGDVDGSVEALSDSFQKLSTEEIQIKIIHKGVGAITESDVLLASASDAIIIGFNVRPQGSAKQLADKEEIDIKTYSIIYDALDDVRDAMEGMLSPELKEEILGTAEIRETFKISKVGTIAGCMITDGKIIRNSKIRLIREGVVIFTGELSALKRFKDDVKEVSKGYDCGIQIKNYNDIKEYDLIEAYHQIEVKKKLK